MSKDHLPPSSTGQAVLEAEPSNSRLRCAGSWRLPALAELEARLDRILGAPAQDWTIDASGLYAMDTSGAWLLHRATVALGAQGRKVEVNGLRPEFAQLLQLIAASDCVLTPRANPGLLGALGRKTWNSIKQAPGALAFLGENALVLLRCARHPGQIRWRAVAHNLQTTGFEALPITGLLSFLMGIVIAYQGAEQLRQFGANIYVADLVGLAMVRELSPMLTAIIVAGRSGSAYAAQIGTMKVTEEIDALRTIGVSPLERLVLPKVLALLLALPLLTVYTDLMGVLGGMLMAQAQLDVSFSAFLDRLEDAVTLKSFLVGIGKTPVFAAIIALVGCYQGFQVGGSADSVGQQTTRSVVQSVFLVIVTDALFSIVFSWLDL